MMTTAKLTTMTLTTMLTLTTAALLPTLLPLTARQWAWASYLGTRPQLEATATMTLLAWTTTTVVPPSSFA